MFKRFLLLALAIILVFPIVSAVEQVDVFYFFGEGCPFSAEMTPFLDDLENKHPELNISKYEIFYNSSNQKVFSEIGEFYDYEPHGVPTIFIGNRIFSGFSDELSLELKTEIEECVLADCISPLDKNNPDFVESETVLGALITLILVIGAGFVLAINPSTIAVIIILMSGLISKRDGLSVLFAGMAFVISLFSAYFLGGILILGAFKLWGYSFTVLSIFTLLAIAMGLFNFKNAIWYGEGFVIEIPKSWKPSLDYFLSKVSSIISAFMAGIVVAAFLAPYTIIPYTFILAFLAETAVLEFSIYALLYFNLIFTLPITLMVLFIKFNFLSVKEAAEFMEDKARTGHFLGGLVLLIISISVFMLLILGVI